MPNTKQGFDDFASDLDPASRIPATAAQQPAPKKSCHVPIAHKPQVRHANHPESGVGKNFHHVPYPLGLMPYDTWALLCRPPGRDPLMHFSCPSCRERRPSPSAHRRKLFLVAERLSWEQGQMPPALLERIQGMMWEVNFQLGIHEPFVEELDQVPSLQRAQFFLSPLLLIGNTNQEGLYEA